MPNDITEQTWIMQDNLSHLRRIAGWSTGEFAELLGITRQTLHNLENKKVRLTRMQYIALRAIFECELPGNSILARVMCLLFHATPSVYAVCDEAEIHAALSAVAAVLSSSKDSFFAVVTNTQIDHLLSPLMHHLSISIPSSTLDLRWLQQELPL